MSDMADIVRKFKQTTDEKRAKDEAEKIRQKLAEAEAKKKEKDK